MAARATRCRDCSSARPGRARMPALEDMICRRAAPRPSREDAAIISAATQIDERPERRGADIPARKPARREDPRVPRRQCEKCKHEQGFDAETMEYLMTQIKATADQRAQGHRTGYEIRPVREGTRH